MPTRILREGIVTSKAVNRLSEKAEIFYRRLMSVADDYGRYFATPSLLRAACYPLQLDRHTDESISGLLDECITQNLIFTYRDREFLQMVKFSQQTRSKSKFPEPVENELLNNRISPDNHLHTQTDKGRLAPNTTPNPNTPSTSTPISDDFKPNPELHDVRRALNNMFNRDGDAPWSYLEESELVRISKRPTLLREVAAIGLAKRKGGHAISMSLSSLLRDWEKNVDHASGEPISKGNGKAPVVKSEFQKNIDRQVASALKGTR